MSQLKIYEHAVVHFNESDELALATLLTRSNGDGDLTEIPPVFPLEKAKVVFNGNQATISVPAKNSRHRRVCRLTDATLTEPKRDNEPTIITGVVSELSELGMSNEDASITAVIKSYVTCQTC